MMDWTIRVQRMVEGDLDQVMAIAGELKDAPHWTRAAYLDAIGPAGIRRGGLLQRVALVAHRGKQEELEGFLVGRVLASEAELELIAVVPGAQGQGIGRMLLAAFESYVVSEGADWLLLEVRASNDRALKLYRGHGFQEVGRRPGYYAEPLEDAILMNKGL